MAQRTPILAIVGRPNVGKSTLFNRILRERRAVVEDIPGVTRDRNYALVRHFTFPFYLVDTGGFDTDASDELAEHVREQALLAAQEADIILVVFDGKYGCQPGDEEVLVALRSYAKPCFYLVNKCDGLEQETLVSDFYSLGIDGLEPISALHGRKVDELVLRMLETLPNYSSLAASAEAQRKKEAELAEQVHAAIEAAEREALNIEDEEESDESFESLVIEEEVEQEFAPVFIPGEDLDDADSYLQSNRVKQLRPQSARKGEEEDEVEEFVPELAPIDSIRIALVGRPNVGKSTLLNTLVGERRAITSSISGTTRDSLHLEITREGQNYQIIDTAGLRKKAKISDVIERYSTMRSIRAISECDVAVVLIDAEQGPSEQDAKIVGLAHEEGKGIVLAINKWDLVEKNHKSVQEFKTKIRESFRFSPYAPMIFISALSGRRCPKVIETVRTVAYERSRMVPTNKLNRILQKAMQKNSAPVYRGRRIRLYYATQVASCPPRFVLFFNQPEAMHFSYLRYLKNAIRAYWEFEGSDIKLVCKKRKTQAGDRRKVA